MSINNPVQILSGGGLGSPALGTTVLGMLPSISLISPRNYFLQAMETWLATPSMISQWIVLFEDFPQSLKQEIIQELEPTSGDKAGWNINIPKNLITSFFYQKSIGCVFAQGFNQPQHDAVTRFTEPQRGFLGSPYVTNRAPHQTLRLEFLETNTSFVDTVIRPWAMLVSHRGLVARPKEESVKTNIMVLQYARTNQNLAPIPRKIWTFFDCAPTQVPQTQYNYKTEAVEVRNNIHFSYNYFQMYNSIYIPVFSLIDKFSNGGINEVLGTVTAGDSIRNLGNLV